MLEDQLIPRLRDLFGVRQVNYLKRFHSFGMGESRVDNLLSGVEDLAPAGAVKLGFRKELEAISDSEERKRKFDEMVGQTGERDSITQKMGQGARRSIVDFSN